MKKLMVLACISMMAVVCAAGTWIGATVYAVGPDGTGKMMLQLSSTELVNPTDPILVAVQGVNGWVAIDQPDSGMGKAMIATALTSMTLDKPVSVYFDGSVTGIYRTVQSVQLYK